MKCINCRRDVDEGVEVCPHCGANLVDPVIEPKPHCGTPHSS